MKRTLLPILLGIAIALTLFSLAGIVYFYPEGKQFITPIEVAKVVEDVPKVVEERPPVVTVEVKEVVPSLEEEIYETPTPVATAAMEEPLETMPPTDVEPLEISPSVVEIPLEVTPLETEEPVEELYLETEFVPPTDEEVFEEAVPPVEVITEEDEPTEVVALPISITPISEPVIEKITIEEPSVVELLAAVIPDQFTLVKLLAPRIPTPYEAPFHLAAAVGYARQQRGTIAVIAPVEAVPAAVVEESVDEVVTEEIAFEEPVFEVVEEAVLPEEPALEIAEEEIVPVEVEQLEVVAEEPVTPIESELPPKEEVADPVEQKPAAVLSAFPEIDEEGEVSYVDPIRYTERKDELRSAAIEEILAHLDNPNWE